MSSSMPPPFTHRAVWVEVEDLKHLIAEQTHASKVDLEFGFLEKPRQVASWSYYAPDGLDAPGENKTASEPQAKGSERAEEAQAHGNESSEPARTGKGRPPQRQRGGGQHSPLLAAVGLAIAFFVLLGIIISVAFGGGGGGGEL